MKRLALLALLIFAATRADGQSSATACWLGSSFTSCFKPVVHASMEGPASTTTSGYLSSADWATFNSGVAASVPSTRTISTTAPLTGGGNLTADRTFAITQSGAIGNGYLSSTDWAAFNGGGRVAATVSSNGYLASADWALFNGRQPAGSYVLTSRSISTTSPLAGGGDLSADRTFSIPAATVSANGYLASADWAAFNGGGRVASSLTTNGYLSSADWGAFNAVARIPATLTNNGYLASADWQVFNNLRVPTTRNVSTTAPVTGGGALSGDLTIALSAATNAAAGSVSREVSTTQAETWNGPCTSAPSSTVRVARVGSVACIVIPSFSCTETSATFFTGSVNLAGSYAPNQGAQMAGSVLAPAAQTGSISVSSSGTITIYATMAAGNFASGTIGLSNPIAACYPVN